MYFAKGHGNARALFLTTCEENLYFIENKSQPDIVYCFILLNLSVMFEIINKKYIKGAARDHEGI